MCTTRCKIHGAVHADELSRPRIAGTLVWVMFQICTLPSLFPRPGYCLHGTGHCTAWHWLMTVSSRRWPCWMLIEQGQSVVCQNQMHLGSAVSLRMVRCPWLICLSAMTRTSPSNTCVRMHASLRIMLCSSEGQIGGRNLDILQGWKKSNCWAWTANPAWKGSSV